MNPLPWILPASFQPNKISYIQNEQSALIVLGLDQVLVFKEISLELKYEKRQPDFTIPIHSPIVKIVHLKSKTYCMHENGSVSEFVSYKELKVHTGLIGSKDIFASSNDLVVLEKQQEKDLYIIFQSAGLSIEKRREYICGRSIGDKEYSLYLTHVTEKNLVLLKSILGVDLSHCKGLQLIMFSVGSNIFWIEPIGNEYEIRTLKSCSSKVLKFWLSTETDSLNILLSTGILEIVYVCQDIQFSTSKKIYLTDDLWLFELITDTKIVFSNGFEVTLLELKKSYQGIILFRKFLLLPGTSAISYLHKFKVIICVTENRIFYTLNCFNCSNDCSNEQEYKEVNDDYLNVIKQAQKQLRTEAQVYSKACMQLKNRVAQEIILENALTPHNIDVKFQVQYSNDTIFQKEEDMKLLQPTSIFIQPCIVAIIVGSISDIKLISNVDNYFLFIENNNYYQNNSKTSGGKIKTNVISIKSINLLKESLKLIFFAASDSRALLPYFNIYLGCAVQICSDKLFIKVPINSTHEAFENLVHVLSDRATPKSLKINNLKSMIQQVLKINNKEYCSDSAIPDMTPIQLLCSYSLRLVQKYDPLKINHYLKLLLNGNDIELKALNNLIVLHYNVDNQEFTLKGNHIEALMLAKIFLLRKIIELPYKSVNLEIGNMEKLKNYVIQLNNPKQQKIPIGHVYQKIRDFTIELRISNHN